MQYIAPAAVPRRLQQRRNGETIQKFLLSLAANFPKLASHSAGGVIAANSLYSHTPTGQHTHFILLKKFL
jgi:hypothetical protein